MSAHTTEELVRRVAGVDPRKNDGRVALLTALYAAGFPTQRTEDAAHEGAAHTLLLWLTGAPEPVGHLYVVPNELLDEALDEALDVANGVVLRDHRDCSVFQLASLLRLLIGTGLATQERLLKRIGAARVEVSPSPDLGKLPGQKEVKERHGGLRAYHAGSLGGDTAPDPGALDVPLSRAVAIADLHAA